MSQKILNDKEQKMETKDKLIEELHALNADAEKARLDYYARAIRLADEVVRNKNNIGDIRYVIADLIREYMEADERYTKAVDESIAACQHLAQRLSEERNGAE